MKHDLNGMKLEQARLVERLAEAGMNQPKLSEALTRRIEDLEVAIQQLEVEYKLLAGFARARQMKTGSFKFTMFEGDLEVRFNVGPYTKCIINERHSDDTWIGGIRQIKLLAFKAIEVL